MQIDKSGKGGKFCFILQRVEIHSDNFSSNPGLFVPNFMHQSLAISIFTFYRYDMMVPRVQEELTPKIYQLIQYVNESNTALAKKVLETEFSHSTWPK